MNASEASRNFVQDGLRAKSNEDFLLKISLCTLSSEELSKKILEAGLLTQLAGMTKFQMLSSGFLSFRIQRPLLALKNAMG